MSIFKKVTTLALSGIIFTGVFAPITSQAAELDTKAPKTIVVKETDKNEQIADGDYGLVWKQYSLQEYTEDGLTSVIKRFEAKDAKYTYLKTEWLVYYDTKKTKLAYRNVKITKYPR